MAFLSAPHFHLHVFTVPLAYSNTPLSFRKLLMLNLSPPSLQSTVLATVSKFQMQQQYTLHLLLLLGIYKVND